MHLFRDTNGPHIARFHADRESNFVELQWMMDNATGLR